MNAYPVTIYGKNGQVVQAYLVASLSLTTDFWTITPAGNGILYSGTIPAPVWAVIPNYLNINTVLSVNILTTYITNPVNGVGCTVVVNGSLPTGWTFDGTTLAYNGSGVAGPNAIGFTATNAGLSTTSNTFSVQGVGSEAADTIAPTIPTGLISTAVSSGQVVISWDASSDPDPPGIIWNGIQKYNIKRTPPGSVIGTTASAAGNDPILSLHDIGSPSPVSTAVQTGADVAMTSYGTSLFGTADQCGQFDQQLTGTNWIVTFKISAFTSTLPFAIAALVARKSTAPNSQNVAVICFPFAQGHGVVMQYRATDGANCTQTGATSNSASPIWLKLVRAADVYTAFWSLDGNSWTPLGSVTQVMGSTVYVGPCMSNNAGGATQVGTTFEQVNIQTLAAPVYTDNTVSASSTYTYQVSSQDPVPNVSSYGPTISVTTSGGAVNFPRLAMIGNGGSQPAVNSQAGGNRMARMHQILIGCGFEGAGSGCYTGSLGGFVDYVHAQSVVGTKLFKYYIPDTINLVNNSLPQWYSIVAANNWYLYKQGTAGTKSANYFNTNYNTANLSSYAPTVGGFKAADRMAKFMIDYYLLGTQGGTYQATDKCPNIDGFWHDGFAARTTMGGSTNPGAGGTYAADWDRDGVNDYQTQANGATIDQAFRDGEVRGPNYIHANSGVLFHGNLSSWGDAGGRNSAGNNTWVNPPTGLLGICDGGLSEGLFGVSFAKESRTPGNQAFTLAKTLYQTALASVNSNRQVWTGCGWKLDGTDYVNQSTAYQACRYQTCFTLQDDGYIGAAGVNSAYTGQDYSPLAWVWPDEFSVNQVTGVATGESGTTSTSIGYMGQPTDTAWTQLGNGVYARRFLNSNTGDTWIAFCNPRGNGNQTFNITTYYPGKQLKKISGTQNATVNSGATVASLTLLDRDGIIGRLV